MCGGGVGGEQKEGRIYLKSEWWSEGGRDTGSTGSFQEELDEGFRAGGEGGVGTKGTSPGRLSDSVFQGQYPRCSHVP